MDREFKCMMELFINGAVGKKTSIDLDVDLNKILELSKAHNIYYSVIHSILFSEGDGVSIDEQLSKKLNMELQNIRIINAMRQTKLAGILGIFETEGIPYALLKGYSVGTLYADPYSRLSGDTDILVDINKEKQAIDILLSFGFEMKKRRFGEEKDSILKHPVLGMVELHVALYNKKTSAVWFNADHRKFKVDVSPKDFEKLDRIDINGDKFYTLHIDKRIEYLFMHNAKHFILGGSSVRAIMDFFLTYIKCEKIDYKLFEDKLKEMGLETLFNTMLSFVEKFISFEGMNIPLYKRVDDELIDAFADDMDAGRWLGYGADDNSAKTGWEMYEQLKLKEMPEYNKNSKMNKIKKALFPSAAKLKNGYKYAARFPILLPIAWIHRMLRAPFTKKNISKIQNASNTRRMEIFKKMKIM